VNTRKAKLTVLFFVGFIVSFSFSAQTFHLGESQEWQDVASVEESSYLLGVSKLKQNISSGDVKQAKLSIEELVVQHPELAGEDLNAFMSAEYLLASGKLTKAAEKYKAFAKDFPESWLFEASVERQFDIANAFLEGEKHRVLKILKLSAYDDGATMMQHVSDITGNESLAKRCLERLAQAYEDRELYPDAYETWAQISSRWPTGKTGQEALLGMARSMHSGYKGPRYQSAGLKSAKGYYSSYERIYTEDAQELKIPEVNIQITEQMAYKQYSVGKYYQKTGSYVAASSYYQYVVENWPGSSACELAQHQLEILKAKQVDDGEPKKPARQGFMRFFDLFNLKSYLTQNG